MKAPRIPVIITTQDLTLEEMADCLRISGTSEVRSWWNQNIYNVQVAILEGRDKGTYRLKRGERISYYEKISI
jgi:hypothetical protein